MKLIIKSIGFRILAILFTSIITGLSLSLTIHIGLFLLYYFYELLWDKYLK
jgi:uncharacterized membrane protein